MKLPSVQKSLLLLGQATFVSVWFTLIYGFTNWVAAQRSHTYQVVLPFEERIPLVPQFIYIYLSLNLLLAFPVFLLSEKELKSYALTVAKAIVLGAVVFIIFPTRTAFQRTENIAGFESVFRTIYLLDQPFNCFPSLHITLSTLAVLFSWKASACWLRCLLLVWLSLIGLSVLFVHQHHIPDILAGLMLAFFCFQQTSKKPQITSERK